VIRLVVATRNPGKTREIAAILSDLPLEIVSISDYPSISEIPETGRTFAENAALKALHAARETGEMALADDSGLVIDALEGAPGILSSRFAGEGATDEERCSKVLELMRGVPSERRTARFVCAAALAHGEEVRLVEGICEGIIADSPGGTCGFGYDPIFYIPELGRTMAELEPDEKNRISHRARALSKMRDILRDILRSQRDP